MERVGSSRRCRLVARSAPVLALVVMASACAERVEGPPPNVLLVSIDTLRRDHVSAYGYERETTPRLDELAAEGALFENALSTTNWTLPAHMSMMTGLTPSLHRVDDDHAKLSSSLAVLPELFLEAGYATAAFTSHIYVGPRFGFDRGFELFETDTNQKAEVVTSKALRWLDGVGERPFFLFLHYFDPHWGYEPPPPYGRAFGDPDPEVGSRGFLLPHLNPEDPLPPEVIPDIVALYDGEIAYTDHQLGRVFDRLREERRLDRTIVVVTSDHGEEFGEHGSFGHATHLNAEVTRIPLVIRHPPTLEAGPREQLALLSDLPLTLLGLASLPVPEQFGLAAVDLAAAGGDDRLVVIESTRWGPKRFAAQNARYKLTTEVVYRPVIFARHERGREYRLTERIIGPALYDVRNDPLEREDLLSKQPEPPAAGELERALRLYSEDNIRAVRLTCASDAPVPAFDVTLAFDAPSDDEPFGLPSRTIYTVEGRSGGELRLSVAPTSRPASLFVPIVGDARELTIRLERNGGLLLEERVELASLDGPLPLRVAAAGEPLCVAELTRPALRTSKERSDLSEADIEKLRALGYVE